MWDSAYDSLCLVSERSACLRGSVSASASVVCLDTFSDKTALSDSVYVIGSIFVTLLIYVVLRSLHACSGAVCVCVCARALTCVTSVYILVTESGSLISGAVFMYVNVGIWW